MRSAVYDAFADRLLRMLHDASPNLPATGRMMNCFCIQLPNSYELSVSIPSDKNRNLAPTDNVDRITVETALFKGDNIVYDDELGYSDVRIHDFDAQAILAEYERLKAHLSKKV